jgi:elongation factor P--beta-lysine ligase
MGGRKGIPLNKIIGSTRKVIREKKELIEGVRGGDYKKVINATAKILAKSDKALDALAYSFSFAGSLKGEYEELKKDTIKERRKELAKKWTSYRKKEEKDFDTAINRQIVDSVTRVLGKER